MWDDHKAALVAGQLGKEAAANELVAGQRAA